MVRIVSILAAAVCTLIVYSMVFAEDMHTDGQKVIYDDVHFAANNKNYILFLIVGEYTGAKFVKIEKDSQRYGKLSKVFNGDFDANKSYVLRLGRYINTNWNFELGLSRYQLEYADNEYSTRWKINSWVLTPAVKYIATPLSFISPYLGGGISLNLLKLNEERNLSGYIWETDADYNLKLSEENQLANIGVVLTGGIDITLSDNISLVGEINYLVLPDNEFQLEETSASGRFYGSFGYTDLKITDPKRVESVKLGGLNLLFGLQMHF